MAQRHVLEETILASAARTATFQSEEFENRFAQGVILFLDITAASGTTPTLDITVEAQDPVTGNWFAIPNAAFAQATGISSDTLLIHPAVAAVANEAIAHGLPRAWRLNCAIGGSTPSFTFSVGASYIL